ncbi:MAG: hypothetical protein IIV97_00425, partial [Oscillospiraceae bacterium]|nr:hypothetical protein [Oscillospiraceae bacterium]
MKKFMCFMLCALLILPILPSVTAADTDLAEIVKMAKGVLSIPAEYAEFESNKQESGGEVIYTLMWSVKDSMRRIYCEVRGEDIVVYESFDPEKEKRTGKAEFSKEEYAARAKAWFKKVNPAYSKEIVENGEVELGNVNSRAVRVSFARVLNGVEVQGNRVYFSLDKFTGGVISMNVSWTIAESAEENENLITFEDAGKKLIALTGLSLKYKKLPKEDRAIIVFEPSRRGMMLEARSGEEFVVEYDENLKSEAPMAPGGGAVMEDATVNGALTENEIRAIDELSSLITKKEVEAKIKKMAGSAVASYKLQSVSYAKVEKEEDEYTYHVRATLRGNDNAFGEVVFNAESGELLSFYSYAPHDGSKSYDKDYEDLKKTAERFVKTHAPAEAEKTRLSENDGAGASFLFSRYENDIEY